MSKKPSPTRPVVKEEKGILRTPDSQDDKVQEVMMYLPHILSKFRDIKGNRRISIKVLLPSGSTSRSIKAKIIDGGHTVLVESLFPSTFCTVRNHICSLMEMTGNQMPFTETDGRVTAFQSAVAKLQLHGSSDEIWGKMRLRLPFECEQQFYRDGLVPALDLGWYQDIQILSCELMGVRSNFQEQFHEIKMRAPAPNKNPNPGGYFQASAQGFPKTNQANAQQFNQQQPSWGKNLRFFNLQEEYPINVDMKSLGTSMNSKSRTLHSRDCSRSEDDMSLDSTIPSECGVNSSPLSKRDRKTEAVKVPVQKPEAMKVPVRKPEAVKVLPVREPTVPFAAYPPKQSSSKGGQVPKKMC